MRKERGPESFVAEPSMLGCAVFGVSALQDNRTVAEYHGDICQYKQSSSVLYTFQDTDIDEVEIRCYVIINASSHSSTARNFYVIASSKRERERGEREREREREREERERERERDVCGCNFGCI